jgi:hypothetical protein
MAVHHFIGFISDLRTSLWSGDHARRAKNERQIDDDIGIHNLSERTKACGAWPLISVSSLPSKDHGFTGHTAQSSESLPRLQGDCEQANVVGCGSCSALCWRRRAVRNAPRNVAISEGVSGATADPTNKPRS